MSARNILVSGISSFFILLYMIVILNVGYVYVDHFARTELIASFVVAMALPIIVMIDTRKYHKVQFYLGLLILLYLYVMAMLAIDSPDLLFIAVLPLVINLLLFQSKFLKTRGDKYRAVTFVALMVFMYFVSSVIKIDVPAVRGFDFAVALYTNNINPAGIQFIMIGALTIFSKIFVLDLSLGDLALFVTISAILTENYSMIFSYLRNKNKGMVNTTVSGAVTALSCQCESLAAAFPTVIVLLLSVIIVPLMVETVGSIVLTSILLSKLYMKGKEWNFVRRVERWSSGNAFIMILILPFFAVPSFEIIGIYLGLKNVFLFFAGINFLMFVTGLFIPLVIHRLVHFRAFRSNYAITFSIIASVIIMYVWFIPSLTYQAYSSASYFGMMNISAVAAGLITGLAYSSARDKGTRRLLLEFIAMMNSMFGIVVFYISVVGTYVIWPEFGLLQATEFAIAMFGVTLPFMWLSTHMTLSEYASEESPSDALRERGSGAKA